MTSDQLYKCVLTLFIGFVIAAFGAAMPWRPAIAIGTIIVFVGAFGLWRGRSAILRYGGGTLVAAAGHWHWGRRWWAGTQSRCRN
jgi:hypothetical protein